MPKMHNVTVGINEHDFTVFISQDVGNGQVEMVAFAPGQVDLIVSWLQTAAKELDNV